MRRDYESGGQSEVRILSGAPFAYVTTRKFLEVFGLATLRDLPDIERLEDEGLLRRPPTESDLDDALGLGDEDAKLINEVQDDWNASSSAE